MDTTEKFLTWKPVISIPQHLIQCIGDCGAFEARDITTKEIVTVDNLRISVELSGGHNVLIPPGARLVIGDTGNLIVEILVESEYN